MTSASALHFDPVEALARPQIEQLQEARLLQLLPYAYARSALVRQVWDEAGVKPGHIRSMDDFREKLPFIDKDAIRAFRDRNADPFGGLLCAEPPHLQGVGFTSGTTGDPTPVARSGQVLSMAGAQRDLWHMCVRPGDHIVYMLFTFREGHSLDRWKDPGYIPITFQHSPEELPYLAQARLEPAPKALLLLSTPLVLALEQMGDRIDIPAMFSSDKGAFFGGEALTDRVRGLAWGWGIELFEYCSLGDAAGHPQRRRMVLLGPALGMECAAGRGAHVDRMAWTLETDGGEVLVSSRLPVLRPFDRFRTGVKARIAPGVCRCGNSDPRLLSPATRPTERRLRSPGLPASPGSQGSRGRAIEGLSLTSKVARMKFTA